jgi:heme/copper-type cytochrome/quinol oxidase subunit 2
MKTLLLLLSTDTLFIFIILAGLLTVFYVYNRNEKRDKRKGSESS